MRSYTRQVKQKNSLDRRTEPRCRQMAQIYTETSERALQYSPVIECTDRGARIVLQHPVCCNEELKIVVQARGQRTKTTARVAWVSSLDNGSTVVGLEFAQRPRGLRAETPSAFPVRLAV